jgi:hypothetical protein
MCVCVFMGTRLSVCVCRGGVGGWGGVKVCECANAFVNKCACVHVYICVFVHVCACLVSNLLRVWFGEG